MPLDGYWPAKTSRNPIPRPMLLEYKLTDGRVQRKASCELRDDFMGKGLKYDPHAISCTSADK